MNSAAADRSTSLGTGGVVTRADLVAGGRDDDCGDHLVRRGAWLRLAPSVYLTSPGPPTDAQLLRAAGIHVPRAVVTGLLACRALNMRDVPDERVCELVLPPGTRSVSTGHLRVRQSDRPLATWTQSGRRLVMPERAVVDGARGLDLQSARALVLSAVCQGTVSAADLLVEVEAGPRRGSAVVRRVVEDALAGAWSAPEAEAADLVATQVRLDRLPPFLLNPVLLRDGSRVGCPDGYLVGTGVGWQVDSRRHHASGDDFDATLAVHDGYAEHGITLLHVTPRRLRRLGAEWAEALVRAVRARDGSGDPRGLVVQPAGPLQVGGGRRWAAARRSAAASPDPVALVSPSRRESCG